MNASGEHTPLLVRVSGPFACFTRPEMKVERVTYDVMTPSAARGILEAIFWKPEFQWRVREVRVLRPIQHFSIRRNEVSLRASYRAAQTWAEHGGGYFADEDRTQRHTVALRDVAYVIAADVEVKAGVDAAPAKYRDQFRRRVARGQCYTRPYLGCREFAADIAVPDPAEHPVDESIDLGRMLFDLDYNADGSGRGTARFFAARLEHGVLRVPAALYQSGVIQP